MKILISAFTCSPYHGSESYFGWSAITCLAREHELWVLTSVRNRADIERATAEGEVPANVHFVFVGEVAPWHPSRMLARIQSWKEYAHFARESLAVARDLHAKHSLDAAHHVTFSTWRVPSPLWQLGIPFVLGPMAGDEPFPFRLYPILSAQGKAFETARKLSNLLTPLKREVRRSIQHADHVFAITEEAEKLMARVRGSSAGISSLSAGFYSESVAREFSQFVEHKDPNGTLKLYAAGNLGGQKCIAVALLGLSQVKARGGTFEYFLGANGPEIPHLKKMARELDLEKEVIFGDSMSRSDYQRKLGETHLYLLPSMRETVGLTMMEAMLAGCIPIVGDNGGPRVAVTDECGYRITVATADKMASQIADVILKIDQDRSLITTKGRAASRRISEDYSADHYLATVTEVYKRLAEVRRT